MGVGLGLPGDIRTDGDRLSCGQWQSAKSLPADLENPLGINRAWDSRCDLLWYLGLVLFACDSATPGIVGWLPIAKKESVKCHLGMP